MARRPAGRRAGRRGRHARWPTSPTPTSRSRRWSGCSARCPTRRAAARRCAARRPLRRRLLGVLGTSVALGDHLAAHPADWETLQGELDSVRPDRLRPAAHAARRRRRRRRTSCPGAPAARGPASPARAAVDALRTAYRRCLLGLAARDVTGAVTVEDVGGEMADLAAATLSAGLSVALADAARGRRALPARGDRHGQGRRPRAQLRQRRRRRLRRRGALDGGRRRRRAQDRHPAGQRDDAGLRRGRLAGRRRAAARGRRRTAGAHAGQPRGLLPAVGVDVGVPGAAQGPAAGR